MSHSHALITGMTGSGKTSLGRQLLQLTPRAVIIDPQGDYVNDPGVTEFRTFIGLAECLLSQEPGGTFRLAYNPDVGPNADGAFRAIMELVYRWQEQQRPDPAPIGLFLEESSIYSTAGSASSELDWLIRAGRKAGVCVCSVVQTDVDIAKSLRRQMGLNVFMLQHSPSATVRELLPRQVDKLPGLDVLRGPAMRAVYGTHYITSPPDSNPHKIWSEVVTA